MLPIESFRVVVNERMENVRNTIANNTSSYSSWLSGLKVGVATDPNRPFVGKVDEQQIVITVNSSMNNSGRPFLRVKLNDDNDRTIIEGRLGLHNMVVVVCGVALLFLLSQKTGQYVPILLMFMLGIVGGGYIYERRRLLRAFASCLGVGVGDLKRSVGL